MAETMQEIKDVMVWGQWQDQSGNIRGQVTEQGVATWVESGDGHLCGLVFGRGMLFTAKPRETYP